MGILSVDLHFQEFPQSSGKIGHKIWILGGTAEKKKNDFLLVVMMLANTTGKGQNLESALLSIILLHSRNNRSRREKRLNSLPILLAERKERMNKPLTKRPAKKFV